MCHDESLTEQLQKLDGRKAVINFETGQARLLAENEEAPEGSITATIKTEGWKVSIWSGRGARGGKC